MQGIKNAGVINTRPSLTEQRELGQPGADDSTHDRTSVNANPDAGWLTIVGHDHQAGGSQDVLCVGGGRGGRVNGWVQG